MHTRFVDISHRIKAFPLWDTIIKEAGVDFFK
jgi:hypothetical protein